MITYQDFEQLRLDGEPEAIMAAINDWKTGEIYKTALIADKYDHQQNDTIMTYVKHIFTLTGTALEDFTASNNKIASNFFRRLNVQRNTYSLGNGVSFEKKDVKEKFGKRFDTVLMKAAYYALIHGVAFGYWNGAFDTFFKATEFVPLWDEETGVLRAGIRWWQIDSQKPMYAVVYEKDGYRKWRKDAEGFSPIDNDVKPYTVTVEVTAVDGVEIVDANNYSDLPIIPLWGSSLHQSTLIGLRSQIDSFDLVRSGFANDLSDVAQIYWLIENYGGMSDADLVRFRDKLRTQHIAEADTSEGGKITPYTQDVPYQARQTHLDGIRQSIYDDFGAFDVRGFSAGAKTATEIDAAYQPLDENADDYEAQIIEFVQAMGRLIGVEDDDCVPLFKRNKIHNTTETINALSVADWLDTETKIKNTPFITVDEQELVIKRMANEGLRRFGGAPERTAEE